MATTDNNVWKYLCGLMGSLLILGTVGMFTLGMANADKDYVDKEVQRLEQMVQSNNDTIDSNNELIRKLNEIIARQDERLKSLEKE